MPKKKSTSSYQIKQLFLKKWVMQKKRMLSFWKKTTSRRNAFLARRPHRSFRLTYRRDAIRPWDLPGYMAFSKEVFALIKSNAGILMRLAAVYAIVSGCIVGFGSQDIYIDLQGALNETSSGVLGAFWETISKSGLLVSSLLANGLNKEGTFLQSVLAVLLFVVFWMVLVWIIRQRLAKNTVTLRDALYNSCAPLVGIIAIILIIVVQLIPLGIAIIGYNAASVSGFLARGGIENMLVFGIGFILCLMSIYFVVGSFLAMIVVMLPGMYPMRAIRIAGDMVTGRRLKILLRTLFGFFVPTALFAITLLPIVLVLNWLMGMWQWLESVPIVPIILLVATPLLLIWSSTYIYILYRKLVESDAKNKA